MTTSMNPDLTQASRLLKKSTIAELTKPPFSVQAWRILERWASYTPSKLVQLEKDQGTVGVLNRVLKQQTEEQKALDSAGPNTHLSQIEIFAQAQLQPNL